MTGPEREAGGDGGRQAGGREGASGDGGPVGQADERGAASGDDGTAVEQADGAGVAFDDEGMDRQVDGAESGGRGGGPRADGGEAASDGAADHPTAAEATAGEGSTASTGVVTGAGAVGDEAGNARNEVLRRVVHASGTVVPVLYLGGVLTWSQLRVVLVAGTALAAVLEVLRLVVGVEWRVYEALTRHYEQDNPAGYALFVVGMAVVGLAFGPTIAVPAMLMLTLGDPVSGLLGSGELRDAKRSEAVAGMFGVCVAVAVLTGPGLVAALLGGAVATLADAVKPVVAGYVVDDNVTIPIGGALAMAAAVEAMALLGGEPSVSLWAAASVVG